MVIFSKFPILKSNFIPHNRFFNATIGEIFGRKGVLTATVETPRGKLEIINVHLHEEGFWFVDKLIRRHQLKKIISRLSDKDTATILCGDFNDHNFIQGRMFTETIQGRGFLNPTNESLEPTYRIDNTYFNGLLNRPTFSMRFDYIFVRHLESLKLSVKKYSRELLSPPLSDHDPIILNLSSE